MPLGSVSRGGGCFTSLPFLSFMFKGLRVYGTVRSF